MGEIIITIDEYKFQLTVIDAWARWLKCWNFVMFEVDGICPTCGKSIVDRRVE